jgi:hypothetical protein
MKRRGCLFSGEKGKEEMGYDAQQQSHEKRERGERKAKKRKEMREKSLL